MIGQACSHRRRPLPPSGTDGSAVFALAHGQLGSQAHVWTGHVIERLEEEHSLPHALAVFAEAGRLARQRRQGLAQGQVQPFDQGRADREAKFGQALGSGRMRVLRVTSFPCFFSLTSWP